MPFQVIQTAHAAFIPGVAWDMANCSKDGVVTIQGILCLTTNLISPLPGIIAFAAVIMIITAGIRITTAGADPKALSSAWSTFNWSVIGLVLMAVVWLVFVLVKQFTGADVTNFDLP